MSFHIWDRVPNGRCRTDAQAQTHKFAVAATRQNIDRLLSAHVRDVERCQWIVCNHIEHSARRQAMDCAFGKQRRKRTFQTAKIQRR